MSCRVLVFLLVHSRRDDQLLYTRAGPTCDSFHFWKTEGQGCHWKDCNLDATA